MMITMRDFIRDFISILCVRKCLRPDLNETLSHTPLGVMCDSVSSHRDGGGDFRRGNEDEPHGEMPTGSGGRQATGPSVCIMLDRVRGTKRWQRQSFQRFSPKPGTKKVLPAGYGVPQGPTGQSVAATNFPAIPHKPLEKKVLPASTTHLADSRLTPVPS